MLQFLWLSQSRLTSHFMWFHDSYIGHRSGSMGRPMRSLTLIILSVGLSACEGSLLGPRATPLVPPTKVVVVPPPQPPEKCKPGVHEVPKLLRVSNHEYQNIVADVLAAPVPDSFFTRWTPVAQVYGFDTMSETRIDSQALTEQLATAERLATLVLSTPGLTSHCPAPVVPAAPACALKPAYSSSNDFSDAQGRECWSYLDSSGAPMVFDNVNSRWRKEPDQTVLLWQNGAHPGSTVDAVRRWLNPQNGSVTLTGNFSDADPGGGDGIVVAVRRNGADVWTRAIPNASSAAFTLPLQLNRGDTIDFVVNRGANPSYDSTGFNVAIDFTPTPPKAAWTWDNCVGPLVTRLASRGFRRPARAEELAEYRTLFETSRQGATAAGFTEPADEALSAVVQAVLLSPNLVFKPELVPNGLDTQEQGYGIASRLSLFVRSSVADDELWNLAGQGALSDARVVEAQARRLLEADLPRFSKHFGGQWLDYRESEDLGPMTAAMQAEAEGVFAEVMRSNLAAERLMSPGFTVADATLAAHYGIPFSGAGTQMVSTAQRGGVLSQALFLTRTATGSEFRRPIHRGLWALTRLMCRHLPRLDAATLEEISMSVSQIDRNLSLREQMELHRNNQARCAGCHNLMDPIGLALEKYDALGSWRDRYPNGTAITSDLELDGVVVTDPHSLAAVIQNSDDYRTCVASKLLTFGLNRGPLEGEQCVAKQIANPLTGGAPSLKEMTVEALMKSLQLTEVTP